MGTRKGCAQVPMDPESGKTLEIDCHFVPNRTAAALRPHVEARLAGVQGATASTDAFRAYPWIMESLGVTHDVVNHSQNFSDPAGVSRFSSVKAGKVQYLE